VGVYILSEGIRYIRNHYPDIPNNGYVKTISNYTIPEQEATVDKVCLFSVIAHISHHEMYRYLLETYQVLKSGETCVFTFREWEDPDEWGRFLSMVKLDSDLIKKMMVETFICKSALFVWTKHLGFKVERIYQDSEIYDMVGIHQAMAIFRK